MSFDASEFVALHDDAVDADYPLDSYTDAALRSNQEWIDTHGHQISWCPRAWNTDSMTTYTGHRPYASIDWSTLLCVPWITQAGRNGFTVQMEHRCSDEHGDTVSSKTRINLGDLFDLETVTPTTSATYTWQDRERSLTHAKPIEQTRIEDLIIWQKSDRSDTNILTDANVTEIFVGGAFASNTNGLFELASGTLPNSTDQHVQVFYCRDDGTEYDILHSYDVDASNGYAWVRPRNTYRDLVSNTATRPLGYLQIRSIQISETFTTSQPAADRFLPQVTVEGRDEVSHALSLSRTASRWRPIFIGPIGTPFGVELFPTGYGRRFDYCDGNTIEEQIVTIPISPRHTAPQLKILMNVIPIWRDSGHETSLETTNDIVEAAGEAAWTMYATVSQYQDGSPSPTAITSASLTQTMPAYPTCFSPGSAFLTQEQVFDGLTVLTESIAASWPYKEGQLFEEDLVLMERIEIDLTLTGYDPSTDPEPLILELGAEVDISGFDFPDPPNGTSSVSASDLRLIVVGYTVWERAA
jgi:hypothetical protein